MPLLKIIRNLETHLLKVIRKLETQRDAEWMLVFYLVNTINFIVNVESILK